MRPEYKAFHQAIDKIRQDYNKYKDLLKDKRMSHAERLIIQTYVELRNNNYEKIFSYMKSCSPGEEYINAHKFLVMGIACNNITRFKEASENFELAERLFNVELDSHFLFFLYLNWYYLAINTRDKEKASTVIKEVNNITKALTPRFEALKILINFDFCAKNGDIDLATKMNNELKKVEANLYHADMTALTVIRFNFYVASKDYKKAQKEIFKLKSIRKNQLTENFKYMSSLLNFLLHNKPLYLREIETSRSPYLYTQLKVLKSLESHDFRSAEDSWQTLSSQHPDLYQDEFQYQGGNDLFSQCLSKLLLSAKRHRNQSLDEIIPALQKPDMAIDETLDHLFNNQDLKISKEELFEILYKRSPQSVHDDIKLAKAISRHRKKTGKEIVSSRGYFLYKTSSRLTA